MDGYGELIVRGVISIDEAGKTFSTNLQFAAAVLPVFIVLAGILAWSMTKHALRPVAAITRTVQSIREDGDLSRRIASGGGCDEIHEMAVTFDSLLDEIEQSMRREQQFTSDVSHELRTPVMAIQLWCDELLAAPELSPEVRAGLLKLQERISAEVRDDGIGINAEDLEHIWERFYRAEKSRSSIGSSGLGLSMVKWIVQVHGGEITATSTPGMGSAFDFNFPLDRG